jgi:hypothetical protein
VFYKRRWNSILRKKCYTKRTCALLMVFFVEPLDVTKRARSEQPPPANYQP